MLITTEAHTAPINPENCLRVPLHGRNNHGPITMKSNRTIMRYNQNNSVLPILELTLYALSIST